MECECQKHNDLSGLLSMSITAEINLTVLCRNPFSEDSSLRSIVAGVIADNRATDSANVDKTKEVGQNIFKTMAHKNTEEYTRQTSCSNGHTHDF